MQSRRDFLKAALYTGAAMAIPTSIVTTTRISHESRRPNAADRHFTSDAVEKTIRQVKAKIADPELAWLFENCYPNTLDTTVYYRETGGKPDTYVITGDIDAMWLRDSTAQVWPYLSLSKDDPHLQNLIAGVVRRQARCILVDPYANAFYQDPNHVSGWATDQTEMRPGVHERKWEIDSLCYTMRLSYGYWKTTGDTSPFDTEWEAATDKIIATLRDQQRKHGHGEYSFKRGGPRLAEGAPQLYGPAIEPVGLICSRFRPSDDETEFQFLIPSNMFAVVTLRRLATMLNEVRKAPHKAHEAEALANEVQEALNKHGKHVDTKHGLIYPYEIDGLGHVNLMDDANVPSLLGLPYLGACTTSDKVYQATRAFVWSPSNPWFFKGKFEGIGGPHIGEDMVWPMSIIMLGLTSESPEEVKVCLRQLRNCHGDTGFMHESFHKDDPKNFTRSWFAWANTLFGEFVIHVYHRWPELLASTF